MTLRGSLSEAKIIILFSTKGLSLWDIFHEIYINYELMDSISLN